MIVITGATGRLGGAVLAHLLTTLPPDQIGVSTTSPDKLTQLAERGVRVRGGNFDDPASLRHSFEGADRILLVSAPRMGEPALEAHRAAIDAARDAGVGRLFYTSHVGADALSPFPPATTHAATEVMLRESGLAFTSLRNGFYADTPLRLVSDALESGELRLPVEAPVSWTTHADLAPAIAALLLQEGLTETTINLTAGAAMSVAQLAEHAASLTGRAIRHTVLSDEEYHAELLAAGVPSMGATMSLAIFQASRQRRLGITDPALSELLGRPTLALEQVLADQLAD